MSQSVFASNHSPAINLVAQVLEHKHLNFKLYPAFKRATGRAKLPSNIQGLGYKMDPAGRSRVARASCMILHLNDILKESDSDALRFRYEEILKTYPRTPEGAKQCLDDHTRSLLTIVMTGHPSEFYTPRCVERFQVLAGKLRQWEDLKTTTPYKERYDFRPRKKSKLSAKKSVLLEQNKVPSAQSSKNEDVNSLEKDISNIINLMMTDSMFRKGLSPKDENNYHCYILGKVLGSLPDFYNSLQSFQSYFNEKLPDYGILIKSILSWFGFDRDGNLSMTPLETVSAGSHKALWIAERYQGKIDEILSQNKLAESVRSQIEAIKQRLENNVSGAQSRVDDIEAQRKLNGYEFIKTLREDAGNPTDYRKSGFSNPDELLAAIEDVLSETHEIRDRTTEDKLKVLQREISICGLHGSGGEWRQDGSIIEKFKAKAEAFGASDSDIVPEKMWDWLRGEGGDAAEKIERRQCLDLVGSGFALAKLRRDGTPEEVENTILAQSEGPEAALYLHNKIFKYCGVYERGDFAPTMLFESKDTFDNAPHSLSAYDDPEIHAAVLAKGQVQYMMAGSDLRKGDEEKKMGGLIVGDVYRHQKSALMQRLLKEKFPEGVEIVEHLGCGNSPARGKEDLRVQFGLAASAGQSKYTHQGGDLKIFAEHGPEYLQYALLSGLEAIIERRKQGEDPQHVERQTRFDKLNIRLADRASEYYGKEFSSEEYLSFLSGITPFNWVISTELSSRPGKRPGALKLSGVRAVPYTIVQTQILAKLTELLGSGQAYLDELKESGLALMQEAYEHDLRFKSTLNTIKWAVEHSSPDAIHERAERLSQNDPGKQEWAITRFRQHVDSAKQAIKLVTGEETLPFDALDQADVARAVMSEFTTIMEETSKNRVDVNGESVTNYKSPDVVPWLALMSETSAVKLVG